ncbi:unnamed protein product [Dibothriocephalus latus]|uniref:Uncharacterized protein n=1 Tax=Dibothriocephalus latus TaxID=60516 RepID=A0A3P7N6C0_DIBLA|nr:unnamed protein product [Dibothriocephalus latus]
MDGLISAITKTAYRGPERSNVMLKKYMTRWLKANLNKLSKKYRRSSKWEDPSVSKVAAAKLSFATAQAVPKFIPHYLYAANGPDADRQSDYYPVKGSRCLQREELADLNLLRLHRLQMTSSSCISLAEAGTSVQVAVNVHNMIRPVVTNYHRAFANGFCCMQTAEFNGAFTVDSVFASTEPDCRHRFDQTSGTGFPAFNRDGLRRRRPQRHWLADESCKLDDALAAPPE